ncbi:carbon-monoxide dehydrogenase medium subunit [Bryocella elongata]|uniref:Carbon-monoxide dehydrogenase medium subunit n=1 Tax=Bryocella elongata TaxID=863522 RepID=A0A1H5WP03_9BACT|nr:FAD binding domain-containing protein [Bryocella elongata]SEG00986.1 carbon-monoxide dehydrogenase medium subunit [Bryocella elongata]
MRSDVTQYELTAPTTLAAVLAQLAAEPGKHTPIAGGTELMVALGVGRLAAKSLLSINHLKELRFIRVDDDAIHIGAGTTFTDIRRNADIARDLPLLASSASWTGSVANQNRGTLGGNICNASPAADTPPALLAYGATVTLISTNGTRTVPYTEFHLGYKRTALRPDELLHTITVPRTFAGWKQHIRKVGTRNAQAISKTALACLAKLDGETIAEIRIGAASLADRPLRCTGIEAALTGLSIAKADLEATVRAGRAALAFEAKPIDDIRSTGRYRSIVAANLLEEFLRSLVL